MVAKMDLTTGSVPTHGEKDGENKDTSRLPLVNVELTALLWAVNQISQELKPNDLSNSYFI